MTTRRWFIALIATGVVASLGSVFALRILEDEADQVGGLRGRLRSAALQEEREYLVHLPEGYEAGSTARYPVLYVLDGGSQVGHTAETASLLARIGVIPEIIVVGVPSVDSEVRNRDYTPPEMRLDLDRQDGASGSAERFLYFLQDELIQRIEQDYRTTRPRMLSGWSRGGLFVVYSGIAAPSLFDGRFAHSPAVWREEDLVVTRLESALRARPDWGGFLYLSVGEEENEKMKACFRHMVGVLENAPPGALRWRADVTVGGVHETNPRLATPVGLCAMFSPNRDQSCERAGQEGVLQ